ncbi:MAG TPA: YkgJ family cysteine cluster protein [Vicinamibacteria bacterium]|nr:YkgJ family cysteine cluster protein [Vicinamibacteria bacterium]
MKAFRFDADQRFSCGRCTRCCRHFDVVVTPGEAEALRRPALAALWSAEADASTAPADRPEDPLAPVAGRPGHFRLRRRVDGACGFLAADGACRIHAVRGADQKPIACRIFPFRLHPTEAAALVTASFSCPTVVANTGTPLSESLKEISALGKEWLRAYPEEPAPLRFVAGRPLAGAAAGEMRVVLRRLLDRVAPDGRRDLRANVARMASLLDDWTRHRVLKLEGDAFSEYVTLTGRFAAASEKPVAASGPSAVERMLLRGFLLAVVAGRIQAAGPRVGPRLGLRWHLVRVALHLHGLWPPVENLDRRAIRRVRTDLGDPALDALVYHFLRSTLETLPTGRRALVDELGLAFATLDAALALAAMRASAAGRDSVEAEDLVAGLTESADLGQTGGDGALARMLETLTGGLGALRAFAARPDGGRK